MGKEVYFNEAQIRFVTAPQKIRCWVGGRGVGKSSAVAWIFREMMAALPGGRIFYASTTLEQIKLDILPEVRKKLSDFGLVEGVHYVDCKRPPEWFEKPLAPPEDFDNAITFYNGFYVHLKSTLKWRSKKGGSYDGGILDEGAETKGELYKKIFLPSIRGNRYKFSTHWHHTIIVLSNRPNPEFPQGFWVYQFREMMEKDPEKCLYMESSALDNRDVLGEEWFEEQRLILGQEQFDVTILNKEQKRLPTGFYHNLKRETHCYTNPPGLTDVQHDHLLEVSFDFGGKFNCCSVWQEHLGVERCVHQFYVKHEGKITSLVRKICEHYKHHGLKYVRVWGEPRGKDPDPGRPDLYEIITQKFHEHGWTCEVRVKAGYRTKSHKSRYEFMATLLSGESTTLPKVLFNEEYCPDLLRALELCDVRDDYQKVKDMEKDPSYPQEHAPHFTDTVDYYLYEKHAWRLTSANGRSGGVW